MQFYFMNCMFCCIRIYNRLFYKPLPKQNISTSNLPWLWIGAKLNDGTIETVTELVNATVEYNDIISSQYLQALTGLENVNKWLYLNPTTLFEEEFPAEGLVIKDDSNE